MSGLTLEQMNKWRLDASLLLGMDFYITINPVNFYNFELDRSTYTDREVKEFDLTAIKNSDLVLVNFEYPDSIGTAIELHMTHDVWGIPVIAFGGDINKVHPWMVVSVTKYLKTLDEAVAYINEFYLPILKE